MLHEIAQRLFHPLGVNSMGFVRELLSEGHHTNSQAWEQMQLSLAAQDPKLPGDMRRGNSEDNANSRSLNTQSLTHAIPNTECLLRTIYIYIHSIYSSSLTPLFAPISCLGFHLKNTNRTAAAQATCLFCNLPVSVVMLPVRMLAKQGHKPHDELVGYIPVSLFQISNQC